MQKEQFWDFHLQKKMERDINVVYNRSFQLSHLSEKFVKTVKEIYRQKAQCLQKVGNENDLYG